MNIAEHLPSTTTRVERHTAAEHNAAIRQRTDAEVARLERADPGELQARLEALGREWDIERVLQTNASVIVLAGLALGMGIDRRFLLLPTAVFAFLAQHAVQGWCPPIPVFRALGVRTMREIERERYAIKLLRGDFDRVPGQNGATVGERVHAALAAVDA